MPTHRAKFLGFGRHRAHGSIMRNLTRLLCVFGLLLSVAFAESLDETRKKAEQGDADAQSNLGFMYGNGTGVPKDLVQAHVWFNIAGANSHEDAKKLLAIVEKDMTAEQKAEAMKLARELFERLPKQ